MDFFFLASDRKIFEQQVPLEAESNRRELVAGRESFL